MKYIYQKKDVAFFPGLFKIKESYMYLTDFYLLGSLSPSTRSARSCNLQVLGLPTLLDVLYCMYLEKTFLAGTGVVGLEF